MIFRYMQGEPIIVEFLDIDMFSQARLYARSALPAWTNYRWHGNLRPLQGVDLIVIFIYQAVLRQHHS